MTRLEELGLVTFTWEDDEDGNLFGEGLQSYEINGETNELAIFRDGKFILAKDCQDVHHAISMAYSQEAVLRWFIKMGKTWRGKPVNERGWET